MTNIEKVTSLSRTQLSELLNRLTSKSAILRELGITSPDPRARRALDNQIILFKLTHNLRRNRSYTDADIRRAVANNNNLSGVLSELGLTKHGDNFKTIRSCIDRMGVDTSHFNSVSAGHEVAGRTTWSVDNIFVENSGASRGALRSYVLKFNILPKYECAECGNIGEWNGRELKLNVDHINGINNDNRPENLRWICPNCHSQTETFGTQKRVTDK